MAKRSFTAVASMVALAAVSASAARELTIEQRIAAQKAIERVYYTHQSGARRSFEEAVPHALLERKVLTYLKESVALEQLWRTPVTGTMLARELQRMAHGTSMPARLRELYAALGDDPLLIQECLARPVLVDRLTRSFFGRDERFQATARKEAERLRAELAEGRLDPLQDHPARSVVRVTPDDTQEFSRWRASLPRLGEVSGAVERDDALVVRVVLDESDDAVQLANYAVPKRSWEEWWVEASGQFDPHSVATTAGDLALPAPRSGADCLPDDTWDNASLDDVPFASGKDTAVWTGSELIAWGGSIDPSRVAHYDPFTDTWHVTRPPNAPGGVGHTAIWTGTEMIVWGNGQNGGRYDPLADTWTPTTKTGAPSARLLHTTVWTGSRMIVWGGEAGGTLCNTGGLYDPATDTWVPVTTAGAPAARKGHTAVWTGDRMIVWGGEVDECVQTNTGGSYDPATGTWTSTPTTGAPYERFGHIAVWTGDRMLMWGGYAGCNDPPFDTVWPLDSGALYDPAAGEWTSLAQNANGEPTSSFDTGVWTGSELLVFNGYPNVSGFRLNPSGGTWVPISATNAPPSSDFGLVWTGELVLLWGSPTWTPGGRYDPAHDAWTPLSALSAPVPEGRSNHTAVWTGKQMIVWGGQQDPSLHCCLATGGRYDPVTDSWSPTTMQGAPEGRSFHTAVWTGDEMIVWGGEGVVNYWLNTGGRYDPIADEWSPTSAANAPGVRYDHTAVWTGEEMVVWGGYTNLELNTGGRYDPATDSWTPTSLIDAPAKRTQHTAIWTGEEMVVWGGIPFPAEGGRYDPANDDWKPVSQVDAPSPRIHHLAVWTGSHMIVWGGSKKNTGGVYDPTTDSWTPTSTVGAPQPVWSAKGVWTGSRMIVWSDANPEWQSPNTTGGVYDPVSDGWLSTTEVDVPLQRRDFTATWTNTHMIVWGGWNPKLGYCNNGGRYAFGQATDADGDGFSPCAGDCNDADTTVVTTPGEIQNLRWPDRLTLAWDPDIGAGPGTKYDVMYGNLAEVALLSGAPGDFCLANDVAGTVLPVAPVLGSGAFYLVRGDNACGKGRWETASDGSDREADVCP